MVKVSLLLLLGTLVSMTQQRIPGLPSDPMNKPDVRPPIRRGQTEVEGTDANQRHLQSIADLNELIRQAESLRDRLQASGGSVVATESLKQADRIERLAKGVRSRLKGK